MANIHASATDPRPAEFRLYIQTIDDGVAPCAPRPVGISPAILSLAICKPALRQRMQAGDVVIGLTGATIARKQGYPRTSIIYCAIVDKVISGKDYFTSTWAYRLDCIYRYDQLSGQFVWNQSTNIHPEPEEQHKDVGGNNAKVLLCRDFWYFGKEAAEIPHWAHLLRQTVQTMRRGCPKVRKESALGQELECLVKDLWSRETRYTPTALDANGAKRACKGDGEDVEEAQRRRRRRGRRQCARSRKARNVQLPPRSRKC